MRPKFFPKGIAAVLAGVIVSFLMAEALLRLAGVSYPIFEIVDPVWGTVLIPGAEGVQMREGRSYVRINRQGFRDHERTKVKPPETFRMAILGDSFTEGRQVELHETFCAVLEKELASRGLPGKLRVRDVEVLNFGVSGYGTTQQWLLLQHRVWDYDPDVVLLAFFTGNDITDNSPLLAENTMAPFHVYRDGKLTLDQSFLETRGYRFRRTAGYRAMRLAVKYSRTLQLMNYLPMVQKLDGRPWPKEAAESGACLEPGRSEPIYRPPVSAAWREAWRVTEALIARMHREVEKRGARFLVVTLSNGFQVHPDLSCRIAFKEKAGVEDVFYPDRRIRDLGEREGFPVLTLAPIFQTYAQEKAVFFHGFEPALGSGHWNEAGHQFAGRLIASWMAGEGFARPKANAAPQTRFGATTQSFAAAPAQGKTFGPPQ